MTLRPTRLLILTTLTLAGCLMVDADGFSQFTSFSDRTSAVLEGNWQSCRESDGNYSERIYDGRLSDGTAFELHMGPYHDFALFRGKQEAHRDHGSPENLLRPHTVEIVSSQGQGRWDAGGLRLEVHLAGGSREDCESWFVSLRRLDSLSSH